MKQVRTKGNRVRAASTTFAMSVVIFVWMIPVLWMVWGAFVPTSIITGGSTITAVLTVDNFAIAIFRKNWTEAFVSSLVVAASTTAIVMAIGIPCAYAMSRWEKQRRQLYVFLISTRILPPAAFLVAFLVVFRFLGLVDTWAGLVIVNVAANLGLFTVLLKSYLDNVDASLEWWLRTQGMRLWRAVLISIWAQARAPIFVVASLCALFSWNEFLYAIAISGGGKSQTLPVLIAGFITGQDIMWGPMFAACTLMVVPALASVWFLEKSLVRGLTLGVVAVK